MLKHAIMIIGYGKKYNVMNETIKHFDDNDIDFFIHWDARYPLPKIITQKSKVFFVKDRIAVKWGSSTQIIATKKLLNLVYKNQRSYDYVHLISCNDIPLMTLEYFKNFFTRDFYVGFSSINSAQVRERVKYWYPKNMDFRKNMEIKRCFTVLNKILRINRLNKYPNLKIMKGPQWFSIKAQYIKAIINFNDFIFLHGYCVDELFMQTIIANMGYIPSNKSIDDNTQAARYIDWQRGNPYIFKESDVSELRKKIDTCYAFARKVNDSNLVSEIFR